MNKCKKCNNEVDNRCSDCKKEFKSVDDIACVKTDFFGDGKSVHYRHICIKCAKKLLKENQNEN